MMRKAAAFLMAFLPALVLAAGGGVHLDKAHIDLTNKHSLQRGAKYFVNYCMGCHSIGYMRYNRMGRDLGLNDEQVEENLMFTGDKVGALMQIAMPERDAAGWFGAPPPDLSLVTRSRGVDWLYTYLRTFYLDDSRPFGVNNLVFPSVGMPHVLWELQGWQKPVYETVKAEDGSEKQVVKELELETPGELSPAEYDRMVRDLVAFLAYTGEPAKLERQRLGVWVLVFLAVFFVVAYLLKKEYWKDVH